MKLYTYAERFDNIKSEEQTYSTTHAIELDQSN